MQYALDGLRLWTMDSESVPVPARSFQKNDAEHRKLTRYDSTERPTGAGRVEAKAN